MGIENIQIIETVSLDFYNNNIKIINVKQMDTDARGVKVNCTEHGKKFKLDPLSHSAFVRYKKPDGYDVFNDCYIQDDGSIIFALTQQMTVVAGKSKLDIIIFCSSGLTVADIGDILNFNDLGIATLSTMTLGLNIHENATDLSNVESSYEYDALIEGLARHVAIEKHMEELESTINVNETQRQDNETTRQINETARQSAESMREINESDRQTAETSRVKAEQTRENNIKTAISNCENAVANADTATTNAQQATSDATTKTTEMQALIDTFNQNVNGVINDETVSDSTTYSSQKIETHDLKDNTVTFESYDNADEHETILEISSISKGDKLKDIFTKITKFCNNLRYMIEFIGVTDIQKNGYVSVADAISVTKKTLDNTRLQITTLTKEVTLTANSYCSPYSYTTAFGVLDSDIEEYGEPINVQARDAAAVPVPACFYPDRRSYNIVSNKAENKVFLTFIKIVKEED